MKEKIPISCEEFRGAFCAFLNASCRQCRNQIGRWRRSSSVSALKTLSCKNGRQRAALPLLGPDSLGLRREDVAESRHHEMSGGSWGFQDKVPSNATFSRTNLAGWSHEAFKS